MNKDRRKALLDLQEDISKARGTLDDIKSQLEDLQGEEQEYLDNMPESLQGGEKGDLALTAIDAIEAAASSVDDAISALDEADSSINDATG